MSYKQNVAESDFDNASKGGRMVFYKDNKILLTIGVAKQVVTNKKLAQDEKSFFGTEYRTKNLRTTRKTDLKISPNFPGITKPSTGLNPAFSRQKTQSERPSDSESKMSKRIAKTMEYEHCARIKIDREIPKKTVLSLS